MGDIVTYVSANWQALAGVLALIVIVGERVAAMTATPNDDKWFSFIHKTLAAIGLKFPDPK